MANNATNAAGLLKQTYAKKLSDLTINAKVSPLWNLLTKKKGEISKHPTGGSAFVLPVEIDGGYSTARTYGAANTLADANNDSVVNFLIKHKPKYTVKKVDDQFAALTENDGGFVDAVSHQIDKALKEMRVDLAREAFGTGYGGIAKLTAAPTATTFKVDAANRNLITKGAKYVASQSEAGHVLRSATALEVTKIGEDGTATVTGGDPTALSWASGDTIFLEGTRETSATPARLVMSGLGAWNPVVAPTASQTLHGVDVSVTYKLYGLRLDGSSGTLKDNMIKMASMLGGEGHSPTHAVMNSDQWGALNASIDNNVRIQVPADSKAARMGFSTLHIAGPNGIIEVVADPFAKKGEVRLFDIEHLYWIYASDDIIHLFNNAQVGEPYMSATGSTFIETRVRSIAELVSDEPNSLGVVFGVP